MGQDSKIEWTHHTFNPWWGCVKVSDGCKYCYADTFSKRYGHDIWGVDKPRRFFGDKHWNEPLKWDHEAEKSGERRRVFCASMADVFEDRADLHAPRERLFQLILNTPNLDWLLLTKRPENIVRLMYPSDIWGADDNTCLPSNVWLGTTCENQEQADKRIPELLKVPAAVRFLSCEPLLGAVKLDFWIDTYWDANIRDMMGNKGSWVEAESQQDRGIDWVIVGGESGHGARPMNETWARNLRDQCQKANVSFFMKQMGGKIDKRHDIDDLPEDLRIRQFPSSQLEPA